MRDVNKQSSQTKRIFSFILSFIVLTILIVSAQTSGLSQTCSISPNVGTPATNWDNVFTQNGPGTGLEPAGAAGWTGADST